MIMKRYKINKLLSVLLSLLLMLGTLTSIPVVAYASEPHADCEHEIIELDSVDYLSHDLNVESNGEKTLATEADENDASAEDIDTDDTQANKATIGHFSSTSTLSTFSAYNFTPFAVEPIIHVPNVSGRAGDSSTGKEGDNVTLSVTLENNPGIAGYWFTFEYPQSMLTYVTTVRGDILTSNFVALPLDGHVLISATSEDGDDVLSGSVLFDITFQIKDDIAECVIDSINLSYTYGFIIGNQERHVYEIKQGKIEVMPPDDHFCEFVQVITPPTCTERGYTTYTCLCGDSYVEDYTDALGHEKTTLLNHMGATCTVAGYDFYWCGRCFTPHTVTIPALGHDLSTVTIGATCEADGSKTTTCSRCDYLDAVTLPKLGHDFSTVTVGATCEVDGTKTTTCSR